MRALAATALVVALCIALAASAPAQRLRHAALDFGWLLLRAWPAPAAAPEVLIIGIDSDAIAASGKPFALMQDELALLCDALRHAGVRAAGFDLILPLNGYQQLVPGASERLALALARLRDSAPLVLGVLDEPPAAGNAAGRLYYAIAGRAGLASLQVPLDSDGVLRRSPVEQQGATPPLSIQLMSRMGQPGAPGLVDFRLGAPFTYIPLARVLSSMRAGDHAALRALLGGKVVLIGAILPDQDRQRLPVPLAAWDHSDSTPGVVFQAQLLRLQLAQRMVQPAPLAAATAAVLAGLLMCALRRRPLACLLAALAAGLALAGAALALLAAGADASPIAAWLVLACGTAWSWWRAYRAQRDGQRRTRAIFAGYVSPAILETILSGDLRAGLASRRQPLAFLFADLRGFTAFCAVTPPEQVIAFLNRYYAAITPPLHQYGGTIDKFSGDGVMVFFGAPAPSDNPCRDALLAAHGVLAALAALNVELVAEGRQPVSAGIGIAYGDAVLGNVGSAQRHDYTATGAATTLAAHLQQLCKHLPYTLLAERSVLERAALPPALHQQYQQLEHNLEKHGAVALAAFPAFPTFPAQRGTHD